MLTQIVCQWVLLLFEHNGSLMLKNIQPTALINEGLPSPRFKRAVHIFQGTLYLLEADEYWLGPRTGLGHGLINHWRHNNPTSTDAIYYFEPWARDYFRVSSIDLILASI